MRHYISFIFFLLTSSIVFSQTAEAYNNRGLLKIQLGDYREAIADYSKVIEINSDF